MAAEMKVGVELSLRDQISEALLKVTAGIRDVEGAGRRLARSFKDIQ